MRLLISGAIAFCVLVTPWALAAPRLALLVGNEKYSEAVGPLSNPHNDIRIVGDSLRKIGFDVTPLPDATFEKLSKTIQAYVARVRAAGPGTISFVYYSGHGAADRSTGINYLIPVDVTSADSSSLWENSLDLKTDLVDKLSKQAPEAIHFVVFDACRSELQLKAGGKKAFDGKGFREVEADGVLIAFSTAPDQTASDVGDVGGPYARALAEELLVPGVEAVGMFRNVQVRVKDSTGQNPWLTFPGGVPRIFLAGAAAPGDNKLVNNRNVVSSVMERTLFERERESSKRAMRELLQQIGDAGIAPGGVFLKQDKWTQRSIKMCFLDGSVPVRSYVARIARQWTLFGEIEFDFGDWSDPRMCVNTADSSDVRITFNEAGNWAFIGMQNKTVRTGPTMSLESLKLYTPSSSGASNLEVLHEFGHVLGFNHAWVSPNTGCEDEFDWPYIYEYFTQAPSYWSRATVDANLRPVVSAQMATAGSFDNRSVMNYEMPEKFFKVGRNSKCYIAPLSELSLRDKLAVYSIYK